MWIVDEPGGYYGPSECLFTPTIKLNRAWTMPNPDATSARIFWWKVARHEMMHLMGADHAGKRDSLDGMMSTMATCVAWSEFEADVNTTKDDQAYLQYLWGDLPGLQMSANVGFESGHSQWISSDPASATCTGGSDDGDKHLRFTNGNPSDFIYQTVRILNGSENRQYRAVMSGRTRYAGGSTIIRPVIIYRLVDLDSVSNGCDYADDVEDPNSPVIVGNFLIGADARWGYLSTSWVSRASSYFNPPARGAYDLQFQGFGTAFDAGDEVDQVLIDNARLESS